MQSRYSSSVFTYLTLVFALSVPFWILGVTYPIELLPGLPISALGAITPALAALILAYKNDRSAGVFQLLRRSFDFKRVKNKNWFLVILLVNPAVAVLAYALISLVQPVPPFAPLSLAIFPMFAFFFLGALAEELGWTGYATEALYQRRGAITAGILLGAVWAIWHILPLVQAHRTVEWITWWSLATVCLRAIMVWFYVHAGKSVFAAALFHAMINLCWQLFPINGSYYDPRVFSLITLCFAITCYGAQRFLSARKLRIA